MPHITVDVNILVNGSSRESKHHQECISFMKCMEECENGEIVMDRGDRIYQQYKRLLRGRPYGLKWLRIMLEEDKVTYVDRANINRGIRVEFEKRGFVGEDYDNYVRTCANSCCKMIVSHDPHFGNVSGILWRRLGIKVETSSSAIDFVTNGLCREERMTKKSTKT